MKSSLSKRALAFFTATFLQAAVTFGAVNITTQPTALTTVADLTRITLSVAATSSLGNPLTYTWKKVGVTNPVQNESSNNQFVISSAKSTDAGTYFVTVRETGAGGGTLDSADAVVVVNVRPKITAQPKALPSAVLEGGNATYNVTLDALGTGPFTYTWQRKNGTVYQPVGAPVTKPDRTDSITLNNVTLAAAGSYRVSITNPSLIIVNSVDVVLKVNSRPVITTQPPPTFNVTFGASGILKLVVGGNAPLKYQWYKGNVIIPKATAATLSVKGNDNAADGVAEGPGVYKVRVTNAFTPDLGLVTEQFTESTNSVVRVIRKPKILTQPQKATIDITGAAPVNHTLSVAMDTAGDEGTLEYQWYKDNKIIPGATADSLSFTPVTWADRGSYKVVITTRSAPAGPVIGTVTSASAVLTIISPPIITSQSPAEIYGPTKGSVKLFVVATGTAPLTYEWRFRPVGAGAFNPAVIGKAASLTLSNLSNANHQGDYQCTVKNAPKGAVGAPAPLPGSVTSVITYVQADDPPKFTQQTTVLPYDNTILKGTPKIPVGKKLHLQVKLTGADRPADVGTLKANAFVIRWLKNGLPFAGGTPTKSTALGVTTLELTIDPATAGDTAKYSCEVTNNVLKAVSTPLAITVSGPPIITGQPAPAGGIEEALVETMVTATGGSPTLTYQWEKDNGGTWLKVTGKTAAKLSFSSVLITDDGTYRCMVSNAFGSTLSAPVQITVTPIPPPQIGPVANVSLVEMHPAVARGGEKVRIFGQNFNYLESVKFGTVPATFVVETTDSILVTVPLGAPTVDTALTLKNRKNATTTDTTIQFRRTTTYENDYSTPNPPLPSYIAYNATVLSLASGTTSIPGDTSVTLGSAYELLVPKISQVDIYLVNYGSPTSGLVTEADIAVYASTTATNQTFTAINGVTRYPNAATARGVALGDDRVGFRTARANQRIFIDIFGGISGLGWTAYGPYELIVVVVPIVGTANVASQTFVVPGSWDLVGSKAAITSGELKGAADDMEPVQFGGVDEANAEPTVLWRQLDANLQGQVVTSFTMSLEPGDSAGDDQFAWQVSDPEGDPLMALWVNAADGTLRAVQPDGTTTTSIQHITPGGGAHRFEIVVDPKEGTWITMMDGVPVTAAIKLPAGAKFGDISAVWDLGADGVSSGASIIFDDFRVEAEVAP